MNWKIIMLFLCLFSLQMKGQKKVWLKFGDQSMQVRDAYSASKFYEKALAYDTSDTEVKYKLALAYMAYQNYPVAIPILNEISHQLNAEELKEQFPDLYYQLGKGMKHLECYDCATKYFALQLQSKGGGANVLDKTKNELKNMDSVRVLAKDSSEFRIHHLQGNINTGASEFSSFWKDDSVLLFSSLRAVSVLEDGTVKDDDYSAKIYKASQEDSLWKVSGNLSHALGKEKSVANINWSNEGELLVTVCEQFGNCKLHSGKLSGDSLIDLEALPAEINYEGANTTQGRIVQIGDKKILLFVSDRPGGYGNHDLWYAEFKKSWGKAKNLGKSVNTKGNELSPYYSTSDSTLYFSSDWHYNLGGVDIFKSKGTFPKAWGAPINMGRPFNTPMNDLYYYPIDSSKGFLTSSRKGSITEKDAPCCNDLYAYEKRIKEVPPLMVDTFTVDSQRLPAIANLDVTVYFHNDRPNKDSWDTLTSLNYDTTYYRYVSLFEEYKKEFSAQFKGESVELARQEVDTFFKEKVFQGREDLIVFTDQLISTLEGGNSVEVLIRGFASPLTKSNYNVNLSLRRISSLMNFLAAYNDGVLKPYINGTAANGARMNYLKNPNGEYKSAPGVSDDYYDVRNSIYNPAAAKERRVSLHVKVIGKDDL